MIYFKSTKRRGGEATSTLRVRRTSRSTCILEPFFCDFLSEEDRDNFLHFFTLEVRRVRKCQGLDPFFVNFCQRKTQIFTLFRSWSKKRCYNNKKCTVCSREFPTSGFPGKKVPKFFPGKNTFPGNSRKIPKRSFLFNKLWNIMEEI